MATYRELHGKAVKTVTTNPTDEAAEGQIWFNSTDNTWKSGSKSLACAHQLKHPHQVELEHKQAGLIFGEYDGDCIDETNTTLEYNGSGFTTSGRFLIKKKIYVGLTGQHCWFSFWRIGYPTMA